MEATPSPEPPEKPAKKRILLRRSRIVILETIAVIALLLGLAAGAGVWRLKSGPVNVGFAKNYIQEALRVPERGLTPVIGDAALSWPDLSGPILLGVRKVKLYNTEGQAVLALEEAELSLSKTMLLLGQISPIALILKEPVVQVIRTKEGRLDFGIHGLKSEKAPDDNASAENRRVYGEILKYVARPDAEKKHAGLGNLEALVIQKASLIIRDETLKSAWVLPRLDARLESGHGALKVDLQLDFSAQPSAESFLKMNFLMPWDQPEGKLEGELKNFDPWFFVQQIPALSGAQKGDTALNGHLAATTDSHLAPLKAILELESPGGNFSAGGASEKPVAYKNFVLQADYDASKNTAEITQTKIEIDGLALSGKASAEFGENQITGKAHVSMPAIAQSRISAFWPAVLKGDNAEEWIVKKLSKGTFTDVYADADFKILKTDADWALGPHNVTAGFDFEGMDVNYRPPLVPVTDGKGKGKFTLGKELLEIDVESGKISDLAIKPSHLEFKNIIEKGKGVADLKVSLQGPLKTGLEYIALEPINKKLRFDPAKVKGTADLTVNVAFPTRKDVKVAEVNVGVSGTLSDIFLPAVVRDLPLTGGPFKIEVSDEKLHVAGDGFLASSPGTFDYTDHIRNEASTPSETVKASINTDPATRLRMGLDLGDFIDGNLPVDVNYTEHEKGRAEADVTADLASAHIFFNPFDYDKKPGEGNGTASLDVKIADGNVKEITDFSVTAPGFSLKNAALSFRQKDEKTELSKGQFPDFMIGDTKGATSFTVDDKGRYKIKTTASFFDLQPFLDTEEKKPYDDPAMEIDLSAKEMRGKDKKIVRNGKFFIDIDKTGRYKRLDVSAAAGKGTVTLKFAPDETGAHRFSMDTDDAGATLAAFGIYQNIRGGVMKIRGKPVKGPDDPNMEGKAVISDFRVVNAPTLAKLISAISLPGLVSLLNNEGLVFSKLEADYKWKYKSLGSELMIQNGRTSGNSVGFTFEGLVDQTTNTININGTMVPLSEINKFIGNIPLVGDLLTGGKDGGLVAATYTVKGKTEKPSVMVNPLSVLTPGILRRILFE